MSDNLTPLGQLRERYQSPGDRSAPDILEVLEEARTFCQKGLGTPAERFSWEIFVFLKDAAQWPANAAPSTEGPLEAMRLAALAMLEFTVAFPLAPDSGGKSAVKPFAYFGIVSTTVEAIDHLCSATDAPANLMRDIKQSELWLARRDFVHVHTRQKEIETEFLSLLKRHDFRFEALTPAGVTYRSRTERGDGYAVRTLNYETALNLLVFQMTQAFAYIRSHFGAGA